MGVCDNRIGTVSCSFVQQASQRRGPGVAMAVPQSQHCPRLYISRRRSMLSGAATRGGLGGNLAGITAAAAGRGFGGRGRVGRGGSRHAGHERYLLLGERAREPVGRPPAEIIPITPSTPSGGQDGHRRSPGTAGGGRADAQASGADFHGAVFSARAPGTTPPGPHVRSPGPVAAGGGPSCRARRLRGWAPGRGAATRVGLALAVIMAMALA